jgi:hypothetical protein
VAGDYDQAAALFEESLALNRRLRDEGMVGWNRTISSSSTGFAPS